MYQVSLPSTLSFGSLRSEEVVIEKSAQGYFFVDDRHGNADIHTRTKFYLRALYGEQV